MPRPPPGCHAPATAPRQTHTPFLYPPTRSASTPPGSLSKSINVQLLESGDIERRKDASTFGETITCPTGDGARSMYCFPKSDGNKYVFIDVSDVVKAGVLTGSPDLSVTTLVDLIDDLDTDYDYASWATLRDRAFRVDGVNDNLCLRLV